MESLQRCPRLQVGLYSCSWRNHKGTESLEGPMETEAGNSSETKNQGQKGFKPESGKAPVG